MRLLRHLPTRLVLYALIEGLALHGIVLSITHGNAEIFAEDGLIEWIHFWLMLSAGGLFCWNWRRTGGNSSALLLCSMLSVVAALRELDHYSEILLFEDAYKYPVALIAFSAIYVLWQHRRTLGREIAAFSLQPAFFFLAFGSFLTAIVAQVLCQAELWHELLAGPGARTVKRVVEESLETLGYMILFLGAIETSDFDAFERCERPMLAANHHV
jgi:hypothetical protein